MVDLTTAQFADSIRDATAAALIRANTLAGDAVEIETIDEQPIENQCVLIVRSDHSAAYRSGMGQAVTWTSTINLVVQALARAARRDDAVARLGILTAQVKTALFTDPVWMNQPMQLESFRVVYQFETRQAQIVADARILITAHWFEHYDVATGVPLTGVTTSINIEPPTG